MIHAFQIEQQRPHQNVSLKLRWQGHHLHHSFGTQQQKHQCLNLLMYRKPNILVCFT